MSLEGKSALSGDRLNAADVEPFGETRDLGIVLTLYRWPFL